MTDRLEQAKSDLSAATQRIRDIQGGRGPSGDPLRVNEAWLSALSSKDRAYKTIIEEGGGDYGVERTRDAMIENAKEIAHTKEVIERYR